MNTSRAALEKALATLNRERDYVVDLTRTLVGFKSTNPVFTGDPEGSEESQVQTHIEQILRDVRLEVTRWESCPRRPNVVGRLPGAGGRSLILNGHIDVVPIGDINKWSVDPWGGEIKEGKLYGRGSFDMKGGVAAMIAAARAIRQAGIDLGGDLQVHSVVDEESGAMCGTRDVIAQGYRADAAIICEPSMGLVMPVEGGLEWVRVTIEGRTNHAGFRFSQIYPNRREGPDAVWINIGRSGVNALEKGVRFVQAVRELERDWAVSKYHPVTPPGLNTINPGVMVAGAGRGPDGLPLILSNPAIIPDICVMEFGLKYLPHETKEGIQAQFEAFVAAFAKTDPWLSEHPPQVEWSMRNISFPPVNTPADHPLVAALVEARREMGLATSITGFPAVTDGAFYAGAGVPSVIYGPTGAGAHAEDEYVTVDSLRETAALYVHAILSYCGVA